MDRPVRADPLFQVIILKSRVMQRALAHTIKTGLFSLAPHHWEQSGPALEIMPSIGH
jgi:hypothetical protein